MNRRSFLTRLAAATAAAMAVGATTVTLDGCTFDIEGAINMVLNSALAILKVAEPNAAWTAWLADAIGDLQRAETSWKAGGAATIVVDALNTIEAVLADIPATAIYSPLIDILFAGIEAAMAAFGLTSQLSPHSASLRAKIVNSPHAGKVKITPSFAHPTWQGTYKHTWNEKAKALGLPQAEIS